MVGDDLLRRFNDSEVFLSDSSSYFKKFVRGSCVLSGTFIGWWARDGRSFSRDLGRPDAEIWSQVECVIMDSRGYKSEMSYFSLMVKGDLFVPVNVEAELATMYRLDVKKVPKYLSCVNWDGFGPSDKALIDAVIERGVAALAG